MLSDNGTNVVTTLLVILFIMFMYVTIATTLNGRVHYDYIRRCSGFGLGSPKIFAKTGFKRNVLIIYKL